MLQVVNLRRRAILLTHRPSAEFPRRRRHQASGDNHLSADQKGLETTGALRGLCPPGQAAHGHLAAWIEQRRRHGVTVRTINHGLQVVRRILNLAASEWMDERGLTWIRAPEKIKLLANHDRRTPFRELRGHLVEMALFAVKTRCRVRRSATHVDWEVDVPELGTSVFIIPGSRVKNGDERVVVLNRIARSVVETRRGQHVMNVFTCGCAPIKPC